MGFIARALTPPGSTPPGPQAPPVAAVATPPPTPIAPSAPAAPPQFVPGAAPGVQQRSRISASSILGAAAATGQQARKSLLGQ
jgi:hypothetical protein